MMLGTYTAVKTYTDTGTSVNTTYICRLWSSNIVVSGRIYTKFRMFKEKSECTYQYLSRPADFTNSMVPPIIIECTIMIDPRK